MTIFDEQGLLLRARAGDSAAFGPLVEAHQETVFNVCYRLLGNRQEAEDLAQEAFVRAYQRLHTFNLQMPFAPWMRRVAANLCLNHLKKNIAEPVILDEERDASAGEIVPGPERIQEQTEFQDALRAALLSLPSHYRVVIELRHFQDLTYAEIAMSLSLPVSDVKSHLFRARKILAEKLKNYE